MPIYPDKVAKRWRFSFNRVISGRRIRATKLLPKGWTRDQAQAYDQKETVRLFALASGQSGARRTIDDAVEVYLREAVPSQKNKAGIEREFLNMSEFYAGRYIDELPEVAAKFTAEAVNAKTDKPLAPQSIRNRLGYLRAACRYAFIKHKFCEHDPSERLVTPPPSPGRHFYSTRAEVLRVARAIKSRCVQDEGKQRGRGRDSNWDARAVVLTAFYSGMRLAEILRCEIVDGNFVLADTKNGTRRVVPVHFKLQTYLHRFPLQTGKRTLQKRHREACDLLGMGELRFHDLRHSAASAMINEGISLNTVGAVLGHISPVSTRRYAHLDTSSLQTAVAAIGRKKLAK